MKRSDSILLNFYRGKLPKYQDRPGTVNNDAILAYMQGLKANDPKPKPISAEESAAIVNRINAKNPGRVLVATNTPEVLEAKRKEKYAPLWEAEEREAKRLKEERAAAAKTRERVIGGDKNATFTFPDGVTKKWKDMDFREQQYVVGKNMGSWNNDNWTDWINPIALIGSMGEGLATAPYTARESNSVMPYVTGVGIPLLAGTLAGVGSKSTGQFIENVVNPIPVRLSTVNKILTTQPIVKPKISAERWQDMTGFLQRRQFIKQLQQEGLIGKEFSAADLNYAARSTDKTNALTKLALDRYHTGFRNVSGEIPTGGIGRQSYTGREFNMNEPAWGQTISEIDNMKKAGVDLNDSKSIAEYQATHIPLQDYGYRSTGESPTSTYGFLFRSDVPSLNQEYGDYIFKGLPKTDYSVGNYADWYNNFYKNLKYHSSNNSIGPIRKIDLSETMQWGKKPGVTRATLVGPRGTKAYDVDKTFPFQNVKEILSNPELKKSFDEYLNKLMSQYKTGWRGEYKDGGSLDKYKAQDGTIIDGRAQQYLSGRTGDLQSLRPKVDVDFAKNIVAARKRDEEAALRAIAPKPSFIGPADTRVSTQIIEKELAEQRARQEAQQRSPLAQTFASFTPIGNPAAGAIGAEMFVNMNPITGPAMSAGRLTQNALGKNPYGFDSNNAWYKNALANLGLAGDIVGLGMFGNMRLSQNAPASSQVLSRLNQQIRPSVKPQTVLQQVKPVASVIGKNVYEKVDPETGVSSFQESPITQRYASSSKPIFGRDEQGVFSEINGIRSYELLPPADEIVLGKPVRNSLLNITEADYNTVVNTIQKLPETSLGRLEGAGGSSAILSTLRDLGYDVGGMSSSQQIRDMVRTLSQNINTRTNFNTALQSTIASYLTPRPMGSWGTMPTSYLSNFTYDANSWTNRGSFLGNLVQKIKRQANTVDYQLGDFYRSLTAKTPPVYNQQSLVDEINQELAKGVGVKKTNLPLRIELNSGNQNINDFYLKTFIDDKLAGDINLVRNIGPYTGGPRKKLTEILFSDDVNNAYTKWLKTPGFQKRGDYPLSYYHGVDLKQQGISGEFNKAINEVLKRRGFGNILSGGTGHSTLGKERWENLVKRGLAEFLGDQYYKLKKKGGPIVNPRGFMDGEPPKGSNWRIPGNTLYNPTPNKIRAISDNGVEKILNPFDETQVEFPGAQYVDEYKMKMGGLSPNKAREILHDGTVHGRPLTEKQRRFFGAMSKGHTKKYQLGGNALAMLRDYGSGISVPRFNSPLPKAQLGSLIKATNPIISPILKLVDLFAGDKKEIVSEKPKVPEVTLESYFNVVDPRKVRATTGQPINPNVDLVAGLYPTRYITQELKLAKQKGLSKEDAWNLAAIAFQESGWGKTDDNLGHVLGPAGKGDYGSSLINAYMNKMKEADRLKITDPYTRLQVYNGLGKIFPSTEQKYHGFKMKKIYGVPVPQEGLNLRDNPLYGKQVVDIRENVLKQNPKLVEYIDSLYKKNGGSFGAFGYVGKGWYKNGGQHGGLDRWFAEKWVDVKTGKPCGRQEGESRAYPACRPSRRVSSKTPKTSGEMSSSEKAKFKSSKTSSQRIPYNHKRR